MCILRYSLGIRALCNPVGIRTRRRVGQFHRFALAEVEIAQIVLSVATHRCRGADQVLEGFVRFCGPGVGWVELGYTWRSMNTRSDRTERIVVAQSK